MDSELERLQRHRSELLAQGLLNGHPSVSKVSFRIDSLQKLQQMTISLCPGGTSNPLITTLQAYGKARSLGTEEAYDAFLRAHGFFRFSNPWAKTAGAERDRIQAARIARAQWYTEIAEERERGLERTDGAVADRGPKGARKEAVSRIRVRSVMIGAFCAVITLVGAGRSIATSPAPGSNLPGAAVGWAVLSALGVSGLVSSLTIFVAGSIGRTAAPGIAQLVGGFSLLTLFETMGWFGLLSKTQFRGALSVIFVVCLGSLAGFVMGKCVTYLLLRKCTSPS